MEKKGSFNKLKFTIEPYKNMYGHYIIKSTYKGLKINVVTTESNLYDDIDDNNHIKKQMEARRKIYCIIKNNIDYS